MLTRRRFLANTSLTLAAASLIDSLEASVQAQPAGKLDWSDVRASFNLHPDFIHLGLFFIASHPKPVRDAIEAYRREIDRNPVLSVEHAMFFPEFGKIPRLVKTAIANYMGGSPDDIALTRSTTEGLAIVYQGLPLKHGDEILTTTHDHFSHHEAIRLAVERVGATWRKIPLFDSFASISEDQIVERIRTAVRPNTRAVGITWVHSSSGLKLPIRKIADALANRTLLIVDGVHGIGVEDQNIAASGCDFFSAGTHKWIFGPRGTAFVWGPSDRWAMLRPSIPSFDAPDLFQAWMTETQPKTPKASWFSPGGFHAFEHYWAVPAAIEFHRRIVPARVTQRIHALNHQIKEGLAKMPHVVLYTPLRESLSSGIVCFDVKGMRGEEVVARLLEKKIIATTSPYRVSYARVAASLPNTPEEVDTTLRAIRGLA